MPEIIFPVKYGYIPDSKGISVKSGKLVRSLTYEQKLKFAEALGAKFGDKLQYIPDKMGFQ